MTPHSELPLVLEQAEILSERWDIPTRMISLHRELQTATTPSGEWMTGKRQHALRWVLRVAVEAFFNETLGYRADKGRTLPLNPDKVRTAAKVKHGVELFTKDWEVRTRIFGLSAEKRPELKLILGK